MHTTRSVLAVVGTAAAILSVATDHAASAAFAIVPLPPTVYPNTHFPTHLALADLDGDGHLDVVVPGRDPDGLVYVHLGNGDATFKPPTSMLVGGHTDWVEIGDFDGDRVPDLALAVRTVPSGVVLVKGLGGGAFAAPELVQLGREIRSLASGDFDGDGDIDLATLDYLQFSVRILLNNGSGSFTQTQEIRLNEEHGGLVFPQQMTSGDVDGDGDLDLVATAIGAVRINVLRNNGAGSFGPETAYKPPTFATLQPAVTNSALGDIDGDGDLDVVSPWIMGFSQQRVGVMLNQTAEGTPGAFGPTVSFAASPSGISWAPALADLDGDGDLDIAIGYGLPGPIALLENVSGATVAFGPPQTVSIGQFVRAIVPADLDSDGDVDLAFVESPGNIFGVLLNVTPPGGAPPSPEAPQLVRGASPAPADPLGAQPTADWTRDGKIDAADLGVRLGRLGPAPAKGGAR